MFGLRMSRLANAICVIIYFILNVRILFYRCASRLNLLQAVLILPEHPAFTRNAIDMLLFHFFLLYIHYKREAVSLPLNFTTYVSSKSTHFIACFPLDRTSQLRFAGTAQDSISRDAESAGQ